VQREGQGPLGWCFYVKGSQQLQDKHARLTECPVKRWIRRSFALSRVTRDLLDPNVTALDGCSLRVTGAWSDGDRVLGADRQAPLLIIDP
jgi:hypothetical protein